MKNVIIINGVGGCGKDEFINQFSKYAKVKNISSVDKIKDAASILGWDGSKKEEDRKLLSDLKWLSTQYNDYPFFYIKQEVQKFKESEDEVLFIHIREPSEIKRAADAFDAFSVIVLNPNTPDISTNKSDRDVKSYNYDFFVNNNGTVEDLSKKAKGFAEYLRSFDE